MIIDIVLTAAKLFGGINGRSELSCCGYTDIYGGPPYMGGFKGLVVVDIPTGEYFRIGEYDGAESIEYFDKEDWYYSEGEYYSVD